MSKALRIATEDFLPQPTLFSTWHPFYAIMSSGSNPPCFSEFMELFKCSENNKEPSECKKEYIKLLHCLNKQGFD